MNPQSSAVLAFLLTDHSHFSPPPFQSEKMQKFPGEHG
ncbi:hypothetical protein SMD11_0033 [Streptomyces albireticuli]|uniref:Uncharacterized protein n=1 Tax=Streptomyces albireticuli TaxID=1940 RepID=A0A1Z2KUS7_9ACTN|nr:hypothetical protein SMD11_0033 [Streptomyces albireticuli]